MAVCEAITTFNDGAKSCENLHHQLNVECCYSEKKALSIQNNIRLKNAEIKVTKKVRDQRWKLRQIRKGKKVEDTLYMPGGFSKEALPDNVPCKSLNKNST